MVMVYMRVSLVQLEINDNRSSEETVDYVVDLVDKIGDAEMVVLPEIWNVGFFSFDEYRRKAQTLDGPLVSTFREKAREKSVHIHMGSFVEKREEGFFNTSVLIGPAGDLLAVYRKMHLFGFKSSENRILTPGKSITTVTTDLGRFGLATCYDLRFPEQFRAMMKQGVQAFLITSAWPAARITHWNLLTKARALENLCFTVACNCAGTNRGNELGGNSVIVNPMGEVVASLGKEPGVLSCEVDLDEVSKARANYPFVDDMVELDGGNIQRCS